MKQETLEEAAENYKINIIKSGRSHRVEYTQQIKLDFIEGAKWQKERSYSEEEVYNLLCSMPNFYNMTILQQVKARDKWFEQFKKK